MLQMRMSGREATALARRMASRIAPHVGKLREPLRSKVAGAIAELRGAGDVEGLSFLPAIWGVISILALGASALGFYWFAKTGSELRESITDAMRSSVPRIAEDAAAAVGAVFSAIKWSSLVFAGVLVLRQLRKR